MQLQEELTVDMSEILYDMSGGQNTNTSQLSVCTH